LRTIYALGTIWPFHLDGTGIVSSLLTMVTCHLICTVESTQLTTGI
jgi:hypothetical protein